MMLPAIGFRFVHAADLHLDSPFKGLTQVDERVAAALRESTFATFENIINLCIGEKVEALLIAGDVYDSSEKSLKAQLRFQDGLRRLDRAGVRTLLCHGNHDPLDGWEARLELPVSCHRFGAEPESAPLSLRDPSLATVIGMSYPTRDIRTNLVPGLKAVAPANGIRIGLLHCNVGVNTGHENYAPCSIADLEEAGFDYWALGHVHTRAVLRQQAPAIVYPGNPQGRHPAERGERGVYLVEVNGAGQMDLTFCAVDTVRWERLSIEIGGCDDHQQLLNRIGAAIEGVLSRASGRSLVYQIELVGAGSLDGDLRRESHIADIQDDLNGRWGHDSPFAWCGNLTARTRPVVDRASYAESPEFVGELLRVIDRAKSDDAELAPLSAALSPLFEHPAARRYLGSPSGEELRAMLDEAEALCLSQLAGRDAS